MLTLRKKKKEAYLIDFSFRFNEIKFCNLLMNWLIWEKIFTYFYTKFRPVNRMHYIKCGVNSSLHNSGCCRRSVAPWITVLSRHTVGWSTNFLWCDIPRKKAPRTGPRHIWHTYTHCPSSGHENRWQCRWVDDFTGNCLLWQLSNRKTSFEFESVSATRISLTVSSSSLIFFYGYCSDTYNSLPYSHSSVWLDTVAVT